MTAPPLRLSSVEAGGHHDDGSDSSTVLHHRHRQTRPGCRLHRRYRIFRLDVLRHTHLAQMQVN